MEFLSNKKILFSGLLFFTSFILNAQTNGSGSQKVHMSMHKDLLTDQSNITKEINLLDSVAIRYKLQKEEDENPALDLYGSWTDQWVNPFRNTSVERPDSFSIDVSNYCMPTPGHVTSNFGPRRRRYHYGIDLKVQVGDTIRAAFEGKVRITNYERRGYGYYIVIRHSNGLETVYGHLSKFLVDKDQVVKVGEPIALGGNTGRSTGSHLHFETRFLGLALNPNTIFDFENQVPHTDTYVYRTPKKYTNTFAQKSAPQNNNSSNSNKSSTGSVHKVVSGDTLGHIAEMYGVSIKTLCSINGISRNSTLNLGQKIRYK